MASVYKKSYYKTIKGKRVKRFSRKYSIKYRDEFGHWRTTPGYTDKELTKRKAATVEHEVDCRRHGKVDPYEAPKRESLSEHLAAYRRHLESKQDCTDHIDRTIARIEAILSWCGFTKLDDLLAYSATDRVSAYLRLRRGAKGKLKISNRTSNYYLTALGGFCRWAAKQGRMPQSPISLISKANTELDDPRKRRVLSEKEFSSLIKAAHGGPSSHNLPGADRAWLYMIAAYSGLRASELVGLTPKSFKLETDPPGIVARASTTKNKENVVQPLPKSLAKLLGPWLENKDAGHPLWPGRWNRRAAEMLRVDLEEAEIPLKTADGVLDFHALRATYVTNLVRSGVHPKIVQTLARHSTIVLTMDLYTKLGAKETAEALDHLPALPRLRRLQKAGP